MEIISDHKKKTPADYRNPTHEEMFISYDKNSTSHAPLVRIRSELIPMELSFIKTALQRRVILPGLEIDSFHKLWFLSIPWLREFFRSELHTFGEAGQTLAQIIIQKTIKHG